MATDLLDDIIDLQLREQLQHKKGEVARLREVHTNCTLSLIQC